VSGPMQDLAAQGAVIERLTSDSRRCAPGAAFFAYPGEKADGRAYIADAARRGASGVLWEAGGFAWRDEWRVPNVAVDGLKQRASQIAAEFHGHPSRALWMCGVTGTNGKTSSSQWLAAVLSRAGSKAAVIGTLGSGYPGALQSSSNTTPDALELQEELARFRAEGARAVAMEVSSHGLEQGRVAGVQFACALFTNLSQDHLDYHGTMQAYGEAKARLFTMPGLQAAVVNVDDPFGLELARRLEGRVRILGYGFASRKTREWLRAEEDTNVASSWGRARLRTGQLGRFNLSNALGVLGCLIVNGVPFEQAVRLLDDLPPVPGRMQPLGERPLVVIDYAHTPDALEKVLTALRPVAARRGGCLVAVFGAGGDRDASKRPLMGAAAARLADRVIITSDNPRSEDPLQIVLQVRGDTKSAIEPDRGNAIASAIAASAPEDVVLIAGKGHEDYQEIAGRRLPFSDAEAARAALQARGGR
jgi:UDP-N-acetylmuramoyl-L-alanyl-D-glutamate--2,6-diaminopimelate ligase